MNIKQENKIRIVEAHLLSSSPNVFKDFYGEILGLLLVGFIRPEQKFSSLDDLKAQIQNDVNVAASFCKRFCEGINTSGSAVNHYDICNKAFSMLNSGPMNNEESIRSTMSKLSALDVCVSRIKDPTVANDMALWARIPLR